VVAALADPPVSVVEATVDCRAEAGLAEALAARILELEGERLRFTHPLLGSAVAARQMPSRAVDRYTPGSQRSCRPPRSAHGTPKILSEFGNYSPPSIESLPGVDSDDLALGRSVRCPNTALADGYAARVVPLSGQDACRLVRTRIDAR
jgi:hypothetical protein